MLKFFLRRATAARKLAIKITFPNAKQSRTRPVPSIVVLFVCIYCSHDSRVVFLASSPPSICPSQARFRMSWTKAINKEPAMVIAGVMCAVAISMPYTIIPIRRSLGFSTHQWDNDPNTHPVRSAFVFSICVHGVPSLVSHSYPLHSFLPVPALAAAEFSWG